MTGLPMVQLQVVLLITFVGLVGAGAVTDVRNRRIPNQISLAVALVWVMYALTNNTGWLGGLIAAAIVLAVGIVVYAFDLVGGGDIKLLTTVSLWAGTELALPMIAIVAIAGALVSVSVWIHARGISFFSFQLLEPKADIRTEQLYTPYAVAILPGAVFIAGVKMASLFNALEPAL